MTFRQLVILIVFVAIFAMAARVSLDSDTWWHLRTGQWIAENQAVPKTDSFSYTRAGEEWLYPSAAWLSQLGMYSIYTAFGAGGLNLMVAVLVSLAFVFISFSLSGGIFLRAFSLILAATASSVYWAARPYLATFVFTAVFLWVLEDYRSARRKRLWLLPLVMLAWANLHPGFATGFILFGVYLLAEGANWLQAGRPNGLRGPFGQLLLVAPFLVLAVFINPSGPTMLLYPFDTLSIGALRDLIQEWQSPDFHATKVLPFAALLFLTVAAVGSSPRRLALVDFFLISVFGLMALLAARNIAIFALIAPVVLTRYADPIFDRLRTRLGLRPLGWAAQSRGKRVLNVVLLLIILLPALVRVGQSLPEEANQEHIASTMPVGAIAYLQDHQPEGPLFNSYNWGGYLIWALPEYPVFVDGRTDLYGDALILEWLDIITAQPDWPDRLEAWEINLVLIEPDWALARVLPYAGWHQLYADDLSVLYQRP